MARLILALDAATEERLLADIVAANHEIVARVHARYEVLDALRKLNPTALVTLADDARLDRALLAATDQAGVRLVALAETEGEKRRAKSLGLTEVVDARCEWPEVERLLETPRGAPRIQKDEGSPAASARGSVITVWGPSGAPGRTTTAIGIAAELAASGRSVVLCDADTYGGSVALSLGLLDEAPGFAAACRLSQAGSLSAAEVERLAQPVRVADHSFGVLTGLVGPSRWPELTTERVSMTLKLCAGWFDAVVVDSGFNLETDEEISSDMFAPRRNQATHAALRASDRVIAVSGADPVSLARFLRQFPELCEVVDRSKVRVLVNRMRRSVAGIAPQRQVLQTLQQFGGITAAHFVPDDQAGVDGAILAGVPLLEFVPKSPVVKGIGALVQAELVPQSVQPLTRRQARQREGADEGVMPRRRRGKRVSGAIG